MDREKVIKEFEKMCGYTLRPHEFRVLNDVLSLLKEQEETIKNLEQEIRDKNIRLKERAEQVDSMLKEKNDGLKHYDDGSTEP